MIPLLQDLVAAFSQDVSLDDITARLGPIASDPGAPLPASLTPKDLSLLQISVSRYPDGKPYTITLTLASPLPIPALTDAFGSYRQGRTDRGRPRQLLFPPTGAGPWKLVLIAEVPAGSSPLDEAVTTTLVLRRDPP